jgi:hypothetical protein
VVRLFFGENALLNYPKLSRDSRPTGIEKG